MGVPPAYAVAGSRGRARTCHSERVRIATFNVENLFDRARILAAPTWAEHQGALDAYAELTTLLQRQEYADPDRGRIVELLVRLGLEAGDTGPLVRLRQNRGRLVRRSRAGGLELVARGRGDWIGWLELRREAPTELALRHTAQVVADLEPDVLGVVEAESRRALLHFTQDLVRPLTDRGPDRAMLVEGNDERGIDVGLLTRTLPIGCVVSHVDDVAPDDPERPIFSRDCPEYEVTLPSGRRLVVLVNHFKSKGYGGLAASARTRRRQAVRVRELYEARLAGGDELVVVMGDLNDTPDSAPLAPLLDGGPVDIAEHPAFDDGGWPGTYTTSRAGNKIDYLLCSPAVLAAVTAAGVHRRGVWTASGRWEVYPTLTRAVDAASDHAALWADVDL